MSVEHILEAGGGLSDRRRTQDATQRVWNRFLIGLCLASMAPFAAADAATFKVLHAFQSGAGDGYLPEAGLVADSAGNLYGTTVVGGASGAGTVFEIAADGTYSTYYSFKGGTDGANPVAPIAIDTDGNLYGTTKAGGNVSCGNGLNSYNCGAIFKITPSGTESIVYNFPGGVLQAPSMGVTFTYKKGTLKFIDGAMTGIAGESYGLVYHLTPGGAETTLYNFCASSPPCGDGAGPNPLNAVGSILYGETVGGGANNAGTVYKLSSNDTHQIVYSFQNNGSDGEDPVGSLLRDSAGNLYGVTEYGGAHSGGTIFAIAPNGHESVLYSFGGTGDGSSPNSLAKFHSEYFGTTRSGGQHGDGTVFKFSSGTEKILHSFTNGNDGATPLGGVIAVNGYLYGTTYMGGQYNQGVVFRVKE